MSDYVVVAQKYTHVTKRDDRDRPVKWEFFHHGDQIELSADDRNTVRLLKAGAIVELATWEEAQAAQSISPDEAVAYRARIAELEARLAAAESGGDAGEDGVQANAAGDGFDDPGTSPTEELKRPANAATVDKWRAFAAASVEADEDLTDDEKLAAIAKIDDPDTDRAFLIRTYGK